MSRVSGATISSVNRRNRLHANQEFGAPLFGGEVMRAYKVIRSNGGFIDEGLYRRRLEEEGYSVFCWTDAPGSYYSDHQHANDQSHWILSGSLELTVGGYGTFVLGPGDRDIMPACTVHSARVIGNEPVVYLIGEKR